MDGQPKKRIGYCEQCQCTECVGQRLFPCVDCRKPHFHKDLNWCQRCLKCEDIHEAWLEELEARGVYGKTLQGEWSRNAAAEKDAHAKDLLQPTRKDGTINPQFVKAHGTKSLQKELKLSKKEIRDNVERYG